MYTRHKNVVYRYWKLMCSVFYLNLFYVSLVIGDSDATITDIIANLLGISR